jgi:hypothetical protein
LLPGFSAFDTSFGGSIDQTTDTLGQRSFPRLRSKLRRRIRPQTAASDNQPDRLLANIGSKPSAFGDGSILCETTMKNVE